MITLFEGLPVPSTPPSPSPPAALESVSSSEVRSARPAEPATQPRVTAPGASARGPLSRQIQPSPGSASSLPWREELAARVESFRRRRARLKEAFDPACASAPTGRGEASAGGPEPEFDFEVAGGLENEPEIDADLSPGPPASPEIEGSLLASSGPEIDGGVPEAQLLEKTGAGLRILSAAAVEAGELSIDHPGLPVRQAGLESKPFDSAHASTSRTNPVPTSGRVDPLEILVEPSPAAPEIVAAGAALPSLPVAPLGRRFLAGMADALILLCAAGLFALVFWRAGGSLSHQPLNFLVLAVIAAFFIFIYFGLFTAITASTPGLLWMGLEVRSFEGEYPAARESFWRAFGYLISIAGLMLGFVWTLVDSEKLSWHDRISNTFLTVSPGRS